MQATVYVLGVHPKRLLTALDEIVTDEGWTWCEDPPAGDAPRRLLLRRTGPWISIQEPDADDDHAWAQRWSVLLSHVLERPALGYWGWEDESVMQLWLAIEGRIEAEVDVRGAAVFDERDGVAVDLSPLGRAFPKSVRRRLKRLALFDAEEASTWMSDEELEGELVYLPMEDTFEAIRAATSLPPPLWIEPDDEGALELLLLQQPRTRRAPARRA